MIKIAHLYYDLMSLYEDYNNIKSLKKQLEYQEIKTEIEFLTIGDVIDFTKYDFFYMGPGMEDNQKLVLKDILKYKKQIKEAINNNKFFFITGNSLELFGKYITTPCKQKIKTLKVLDFYSMKEYFRLTDDAIVKTINSNNLIFGFQNQNSTMHNLTNPLFEIVDGIGSFPNSKIEGIHYKNFYGTYLNGPLLVKNPKLLKDITKQLILSKKTTFEFKKFQFSLEQKEYNKYIKNYYSSLQKIIG